MPDTAPPTFFYYCPLDNENRKRWLRELLLDNRVYFRSRVQFNDPNELRPGIVFEGTDNQLHRFAREQIRLHSPRRFAPAQRLLEENKLIYMYRNRPEVMRNLLHEILDGIGLLCLSETATEPLLWAHYAYGHRGVCVEFDSERHLFQGAQRVTYTNVPPVINRVADDLREMLQKSMLTKNAHFGYEQEWRVIARHYDEGRIEEYLRQHPVSEELASFIRIQNGPGHYSFSVDAIRSVILGAAMQPEEESWVRSVVSQMSRALPMRRATPAPDGTVTVA